MPMLCICDGCGVEEPAETNGMSWFKPYRWFSRTPEGESKPIIACSRNCIEKIEEKRKEEGKESNQIVLPI